MPLKVHSAMGSAANWGEPKLHTTMIRRRPYTNDAMAAPAVRIGWLMTLTDSDIAGATMLHPLRLPD